MLRREQKIKNIVLFTLFSILFIGVGYAVISSRLNINGNLQISKITWDVHFENFQEAADNSVQATTHTISTNGTTLTYNVKLMKPGDKYSFTVDVVNDGTIDAMIKTLGSNGLTEDQQNLFEYSLTYIDGNSPKEKDALPAGDSETILVTIKSKSDIDKSQLSSSDETLTLKLNPTYAQDDGTSVARPNKLYNIVKKGAVLDNIKSDFVSSTTGIDLSQISSDTNGKGVYILSSTKDNKKPIYYYRGAVDNNNVLFANYCWKIVRTTNTGGVKMIFSGNPSDGKCNNSSGASVQLTQKSFNEKNDAPAYVGYMYGSVYNVHQQANPSGTFSTSVTYSGGKYTLNSTSQTLDNNHHYTCGDDSTSCEVVKYYFYKNGENGSYIELTGGKIVNDDLLNEMFSNKTNSYIKNYLENDWYENHMTNYTDKLEDAIYCNDRSIAKKSGWEPNGGTLTTHLEFSQGNISNPFQCTREEDKFTVSASNGNGKLKYPVGLITYDEVLRAGGVLSVNNNTYYLFIDVVSWTFTPRHINPIAIVGDINLSGSVGGNYTTLSRAIRPVISLKTGNTIKSGNGTGDNPYVIN